MNNAVQSLPSHTEDVETLSRRLELLTKDHERIQEKLIHEQSLLNALMDNLPDTIFIKDTESRFTHINKAHAKLLGLNNPDEAVGKTESDFFFHTQTQPTVAEEQAIMQTGKPVINKIERICFPDNTSLWFATTKVPIFDKCGNIDGTVGVSRDITSMKEFEDSLQKTKQDLEIRIAERTADLQQANARLESRIAQLDFLNTISFELAQYIRVDELLEAILMMFLSRFPNSMGSICIQTGTSFRCMHATGMLDTIECAKASEQAILEFLRIGGQNPVLIPNWTEDMFLSQYKWENCASLPCYIAIPLKADNRCLAVVQLFTVENNSALYDLEISLLTTLAAHAASCLLNTMHYKDLETKARLDGELDAARSIQSHYIPQYKPEIPHVNIKGAYHPANEVGGDYLDYFKTQNNDWIIVVADVCGKGVPAALLMTMLRSTFRALGRNETSAKGLLCSVNDFMIQNFEDRSFVTALALIVSSDGTSMSYARAGHPHLLVVNNKNTTPKQIMSEGLALGIVADSEKYRSMIAEQLIPLCAGDKYLVYTDGLTEATDPSQQVFGLNRIFDVFGKNAHADADSLINIIVDSVRTFSQSTSLRDDLTMLALQVL